MPRHPGPAGPDGLAPAGRSAFVGGPDLLDPGPRAAETGLDAAGVLLSERQLGTHARAVTDATLQGLGEKHDAASVGAWIRSASSAAEPFVASIGIDAWLAETSILHASDRPGRP